MKFLKMFLLIFAVLFLFNCENEDEIIPLGSIMVSMTSDLETKVQVHSIAPNLQKQAQWKELNGGVRIDLENFKESNYLIVDMNPIEFSVDNNIMQKVILSITHQIRLQPNVEAEIEYTLDNTTWQSFIPISNYFLTITETGIKANNINSEFKNKYPPIVFSKDVTPNNGYHKLYPIHIAGTSDTKNHQTKLNINDVTKIKAFRFRLKAKEEKIQPNSYWEIKKLTLTVDKYAKDIIVPSNKSLMKVNTLNYINDIQSTLNIMAEGGVCPLPHGH